MPEHDDFYMPAHIDEQVDALRQARGMPARDLRLAADLHDILTNEQDDARSLDTVLQRFLREIDAQPGQDITSITAWPSPQGRPMTMQNNASSRHARHIKPALRVLAALAAALLVAALVVSMSAILRASQQPAKQGNPGGKATVSAGKDGQIIYHSGPISEISYLAWSPDGRRIATVSRKSPGEGWQITSWDALTGQHVVNYNPGVNMSGVMPTMAIAWSPDGKYIAAVTFDWEIFIFDAQSGKHLHTLKPSLTLNHSAMSLGATSGSAGSVPLSSLLPSSGGMTGLLPQIAWSPDNAYLAESMPGKIVIWSMATNSPVRQIADSYNGYINYLRVFWEPRGKFLAILSCSNMQCAPNTANAEIWDTATWRIVKQYPNVFTLDWSPDGKQLALVSVDEHNVRIVDAFTGQMVKQFSTSTSTDSTRITRIQWSPDGSRLLGNIANETISLWSIASGTLLFTFPAYSTLGNWSPDGRYIVSAYTGKLAGKLEPGFFEIIVWVP